MLTVLEVGGTHVTAALVDGDLRIRGRERCTLDSSAGADDIVDALVGAVDKLDSRTSRLVVAIPGPFDYEAGIGDFEGVAKFGALKEVNLREQLAARLGCRVQFVNDVTAYSLGQYEFHDRPRRLVTITLGTGVGSAFLADGVPVEEGLLVPPHGWVYLLEHDGRPIEETFSRRAVIAAYQRVTGREVDVAEIAALALDGQEDAVAVMHHAYRALAETLAPWLIGFRTDVLVIGGSIAQSWALVERWLSPMLDDAFHRYQAKTPRIAEGRDGELAALIGAAIHARTLSR